jgi:hypothetical protein
MLLTVCIVAVVLHTPSVVIFGIKPYYSYETQIPLQDALHVTKVFSTLNFAINFVLYFFSGSTFRIHVVCLAQRLRLCIFQGQDGQSGSRQSYVGTVQSSHRRVASRLT